MHLRSIYFWIDKLIVLVILIFFIILFYWRFILSQLIWLIGTLKISLICIVPLELRQWCNWSKTYIFFLLIAFLMIDKILLILKFLILLTYLRLIFDIINNIVIGMIYLDIEFILIINEILINSIYWLVRSLAVLRYFMQLILTHIPICFLC